MSEGLGVLIRRLVGNHSTVEAWAKGEGQIIKSLSIDDNELKFEFENGYKMSIFDAGQSCCETRYMSCDDELNYYIGSKLLDVEIKEYKSEGCEDGEHEVAFLEVTTDKGSFQCANHNEHNGYYGGFSIEIRQY